MSDVNFFCGTCNGSGKNAVGDNCYRCGGAGNFNGNSIDRFDRDEHDRRETESFFKRNEYIAMPKLTDDQKEALADAASGSRHTMIIPIESTERPTDRERIASLESEVADLKTGQTFSLILSVLLLVVLLVISLFVAAPARGQTIASELDAALTDCKKLDATTAKYTQYLTLYNIEPESRVETVQAISSILNHISRSPVMVIPVRVNDTLIRFSLLDIAPDRKDFEEWWKAREKLADIEPYLHLQTEVADVAPAETTVLLTTNTAAVTTAAVSPAPVFGTGKPQTTRQGNRQAVVAGPVAIPVIPIPALSTTASGNSSATANVDPKAKVVKLKTKIVSVDGGWVGLEKAAKLSELTYSKVPLMRADFFADKATIPPFYYDFAGVPEDINDWLKKFGTSKAELFDSLKSNHFANIVRSGVTDKFRRAGNETTRDGRIYWTIDNRGQNARKDVLRNPDQNLDFDASELIAIRSNGLHEFALSNNKFKRQDAVPPDIAIDSSVTPPEELKPMRSCIRCHDVAVAQKIDAVIRDYPKLVTNQPGYETNGLLAVHDVQASLLAAKADSRTKASKGRLDLDNPKVAADLAAAYADQEQLLREMNRDREDFAKAVAKATTGLTPKQSTAAVAKLVKDYEDLVTPLKACRELGIDPTKPEDAAAALRKRFDGTHDPVLILLAQGTDVQRPQFEASWQEASLLSEVNKPVVKVEAKTHDEITGEEQK